MKTKTMATLGVIAASVATAVVLVPAVGARQAAKPNGVSIKVHGRWTITVRDRNGHVAATRRFENSLVGLGQERLISLLWGVSVAPANGAGWGIIYQHQDANSQAKQNEAVPISRRIHISSSDWNEDPQNLANITLWGSVKATSATQLVAVGTSLKICGGTYTAAACPAPTTPPTQFDFTYKKLDSPLPVAAGQTIDFTVVLYFS